jgi:alpha-tubulin suppressor-like RCC1 family protein
MGTGGWGSVNAVKRRASRARHRESARAIVAAIVLALVTSAFAVALTSAGASLLPAGFTQISAGGAPPNGANPGGSHSCAVTAAGALQCWGWNGHGQLGDGTTTNRLTPTAVSGMGTNVTAVSAGGAHTCARKSDNTVWCWGLNDHHQVGNIVAPVPSSTAGVLAPMQVFIKLSSVSHPPLLASQVAGGGEFTCAVSTVGGAWCWGRNDSGQVGDGVGTADEFPASGFTPRGVVGLSSPGMVTAVATGGKHACALTTAGGVRCWGLDATGQVGDGTTTGGPAICASCRPSPVDVTGLSSGVSAIAAGGQHTCAVMSADGSVQCWGSNSNGQLGVDKTATPQSLVPVLVPALTGVTAISAGGNETCAKLADSSVTCWGQNSSGQLGNLGTTDSSAPVDVAGTGPSAAVSSLDVGLSHACIVVSSSGNSGCWGNNATGQLGDGSTAGRLNPFLPYKPGSVVATGGDTVADITFNPSLVLSDYPISGYTVTGVPDSGPAPAPVPVPAGGPYSAHFGSLTNGTTFTFTVTATNAIGTASASATAVTIGAPSAPQALSVAPADSQATVTWLPPATDNGSHVVSYQVTVSPGGKNVTVPSTRTNVTIDGLTNGSNYTFTTKAKNGFGYGPGASVNKTLPVPKSGYWMLGADGAIYAFGNSKNLGRASYPNWPTGVAAVAIKALADGSGYWIVDSVGGVHAFGNAHFFGDHPALAAGERVSTLSPTPTGNGYWLFTNRGRAVNYGGASFFGDMRHTQLNGPVIASSATPTGKGYYMVASDGGVFSFGDARFYGSTGNMHLNKPVVGLSPTPTNKGYWLVATDGGVFAFGNAPFRGSMGGVRLNKPVNGLVPFGTGYLMVASDGGIFDFSNKPFFGSLGAHPPAAPVIGVTAFVH